MDKQDALHSEEDLSTTRTWLLALVGGLAGLGVWWITEQQHLVDRRPGAALITWLCIAATSLAFTYGALRPRWSVLFSASAATVGALIAYWNLAPGEELWREDPAWRFVSAALALIIAVPIFQTARDAGRWTLPYPELHRYAWTNVVIGFGAMLFFLISIALIELWGQLFRLIGVNYFADLFNRGWFTAIAFGATAASGVSLLREWSRIVGTLQRVVMAVLAVLTPVLGFALLLFLVFLPFTGLAPLWGATKSTTPIILSVVLLALLLVNSVLADRDDEQTRSRVLRLGAMALGIAILPLATIAAASIWLRIAQHGLTPDRCWAVIFVVFALAYGLTYLAPLARGLSGWPNAVRRGNVLLALAIGGVALLLATPMFDFAALSARNQVGRLLEGKVSVATFDFAALKFDFGEPGKRALATLRSVSERPDADAIRIEVARIDKIKNRWEARETRSELDLRRDRALAAIDRAALYPRGAVLPPALRTALAAVDANWLMECKAAGNPAGSPAGNSRCAILLVSLTGDARPEAVVFTRQCYGLTSSQNCSANLATWHETMQGWKSGVSDEHYAEVDDALLNALADGKFETKLENRPALFINGLRVRVER